MSFFSRLSRSIFGQKINNTRIFPVSTKIIIIFSVILLVSNLASNYINLTMNIAEQIKLMKQLLISELKEIYIFCNNQYEIYKYNNNLKASISSIEKRAKRNFKNKKSIMIGMKPDGSVLFMATKINKTFTFSDKRLLNKMLRDKSKSVVEGFITFTFNNEEYFGVYKYNKKWDVFIIRAEEVNEFYKRSRQIFTSISIIIIIITLLSAIIGIFILKRILRFLQIISSAIMRMTQRQQLEIIEMKGAPNDDITFLGVAFNTLSNTINNLIDIFRRFANRDVAIKAYREKEVRLEGTKKELTCLFSDIKSFTYMTETLGEDVINLLNMHYNRAIKEILDRDGIIGSIIGDALLAVFGAIEESRLNKSYAAVEAAYMVHDVAASLREKMKKKRNELLRRRGKFTPAEERVYKAVLIEVGVGIDGGTVFYGNIGSYERMTNTVIGDNVNSASRLEGLTRIYKIPVICSEYVKSDIEQNVLDNDIVFIEVDRVQVKGKTIGKTIYWPIFKRDITRKLKQNIKYFSEALLLYYDGRWRKAYNLFSSCDFPLAEVFKERTKGGRPPKDWRGIWAMKTK